MRSQSMPLTTSPVPPLPLPLPTTTTPPTDPLLPPPVLLPSPTSTHSPIYPPQHQRPRLLPPRHSPFRHSSLHRHPTPPLQTMEIGSSTPLLLHTSTPFNSMISGDHPVHPPLPSLPPPEDQE